MDTHPIRIRPLIPPLLIGMLSLVGICVVLAAAFVPRPAAEPVQTKTPTPFKFALLATETMIPTPGPETPESLPLLTSDETNPALESVPFSAPTEESASTPSGFNPVVASPTLEATLNSAAPLPAGIYDDRDTGFAYSGDWFAQESTDAYQAAVLISDIVGNSITFRFIGTQIWLGFQGSENAGEMTMKIDGVEFVIDQQLGDLWISDEVALGTHSVILTHTSGGPVNLDYIEIVE